MTSKKNQIFTPSPLSTCVHMSQTTSPSCGRPHAVDMKYTSLFWNGYSRAYNALLGLKLKFDYIMIVIYLKLYYRDLILLIIFITNLC